MNEVDKGSLPIGWLKRHDCVGLFDGINSLKSKLLLTCCESNCKLMITHWCIKHPAPLPLTKLVVNCGIAPRNQVCNKMSDRVKGDIINAEAPNKVINASNMLLMWVSCEDCFKEPTAIGDLSDVANLLERGNASMHDNSLALAT
jgi:hypothetical protein